MTRGFAPGKIILSGEYAVVFGYAGIAVPSAIGVDAVFNERSSGNGIEIEIRGVEHSARLRRYVENIIDLKIRQSDCRICGRLAVDVRIPIGKGMGSSTALVIAISRALGGANSHVEALQIENTVNPGHSGLDFATIWEATPILFRSGESPQKISLASDILKGAVLIDTGAPHETTPELVAWMKGRQSEITEELKVIGDCTQRLASGEPLPAAMRDHHRAQVALGVVPAVVQKCISEIESAGWSAKVIGAGGRTGGAGIVLAVGDTEEIARVAKAHNFPTIQM